MEDLSTYVNIRSFQWAGVPGINLRMTKPTLFRCPRTGMNVQHWLADVPEDAKDSHSAVLCPACTKTHFVHNSTGKLLGVPDK
jgi:hypothetical protein